MSFFNFGRRPEPQPAKPPAPATSASEPDEDDEDDPSAAFETSPEELAARWCDSRFEGVALVDVREPHEWAQVRLAGALHVPLRQVPARVEEIRAASEGKPVVTICAHGMRSLNAAVFLHQSGIAGVRSLAGGIAEWMEKGLPGAEGPNPA